MATERRYSQNEVREILRRAQSTDTVEKDDHGLSRQELLETAREVGLNEAAVSTALARYDSEQELSRYENEARALGQRAFVTHAIVYICVGALLVGINLMAGGPLWCWIPLLAWGLGLLLHLRGAVSPHPDRLRKRALRRQARERLRSSSKHLGHALSEGAAALMSATARRIEGEVARHKEGGG